MKAVYHLVMEPRDDDMSTQIRKWLEKQKPYVQALIRRLSRDEVEQRIPDTLRSHVTVETHEDMILVKAHEVPAAIALVQRMANEDSQIIAAELQSNYEVGSRDRDDHALDSGRSVGRDGALGVENLPGAKAYGLKLPSGDDEHIADGERGEVGGKSRDGG
jgi:hypothetical protein